MSNVELSGDIVITSAKTNVADSLLDCDKQKFNFFHILLIARIAESDMGTPRQELENYFRHAPTARAALDTLVKQGCDDERLLELVALLWRFRWAAKTENPDWHSKGRRTVKADPKFRNLAKVGEVLANCHESGAQFFVDLAESEADLKRIDQLRKLKDCGKLMKNGNHFFRPERRQRRREVRGINLLMMSEQFDAAIPILEKAAAIRLDGIADLIQKRLIEYVEKETGRAHYAEVAALFPQPKSGKGPFTQTAIRQWRYDKRDLFDAN